jgi:hypothetical protein
LRIGLLTTSFPRHEGDVPGVFVLGFARALVACGHQLRVLAPEPDVPQPLPRFDGIDLRWLRYLPRQAWQRSFYGAGVLDNLRTTPLAALGLLPFMGALLRATRALAHEVDALVSHWALPSALVAGSVAGSARPKLPHLAVLHSADVFVLELLPGASLWAARIAAGADALLFSSR